MNGSLSDASGVLVATLLGVPFVLLPGFALGSLTGILGFRALAPADRVLCAALLGIGLLPVLDSLLVQAAGLPVAALANGALGLAGLVPAIRTLRSRIDLPVAMRGMALAALWLGIVGYALIDIDTGTGLYQPVTVIDLVKHAGLTRAIVEGGLPPVDPFFARPERAGYYYFFYTLCALVDWAGGTLVDGRTAFAGLAFWTGIGLLGLLDRLIAATGLVRDAAPHRVPPRVRRATLLLLPAAGLDILLVVRNRVETGFWIPMPEWLNEQVLNWPSSLVWVPHHVAATLAAWLGLLTLAEAADGTRRAPGATVAVAGIAFAACAGLSVWVCLGTVAAAGIWLALLASERRWRDVGRLVAAGLVAAVLAAPYLAGLLAGRTEGGQAIAFAIRKFGPLEGGPDGPARTLLCLILLPVNYYLAFGVFAAGAFLYWRTVPRAVAHAREAGRLLTVVAASSLLIGGVLRSAILNNDLGWRVVLLAQVAALAWTVIALTRDGQARPRLPGLIAGLLLLGYATTLYGFAGLRAYPASGHPSFAFLNARPDIDRALRAAYAWAGTHLPGDLVLQQAPAAPRVFDFGLYGRQPVAVADREARLFGASQAAVAERLSQVEPIFRTDLDAAAVRRRAEAAGIGALIVTPEDAPWGDPGSWVWRGRPLYAAPLVRILSVADLGGGSP